MKELHAETQFAATAQGESSHTVSADDAVSFAPDENRPAEHDDTIYDESSTDFEQEETLEQAETLDDDHGIKAHEERLDERDFIDTEEADTEYGEASWSEEEPVLVYDVPRPALTIDEAATILGKSIRAIERSISGKWGNRLPEGWKARRMKIDGVDEWRIIPPPSFRIRHSNKVRTTPRTEEMASKTVEQPVKPRQEDYRSKGTAETLFGFTLNSIIETASKKAKTELVKAAEYALDNNMEHPTIVIDRSDDVEKLLRELASVQKELSEERKMHLEDLRMFAEMQGSMRLLESKSSQTSMLKEELYEATRALQEHKRQYQEFLALPWWKRLFKKAP